MMGRQRRDQGRLFYEFRLEDRVPENHLLRRMNVFVTVALAVKRPRTVDRDRLRIAPGLPPGTPPKCLAFWEALILLATPAGLEPATP